MPTVVFLSSKGGAGKSTAALLLALGLARRTERVAIIDADPNLPLYRWGALPDKPSNIMVFGTTSPEELRDTLPFAETWGDWVIVDTEGSMRARGRRAAMPMPPSSPACPPPSAPARSAKWCAS